MELGHFLHWLRELRHRHARWVLRALAAYAVVATALVEVTEPVMHALHLPEWTLSFVVIFLGLGFPVVAVIAWISSTGVQAAATPAHVAVPGPDAGLAPADRPEAPPARVSLRAAALLVGLGLLLAAPGLVYQFVLRGRSGGGPAAARSIAVLPFADMSAARDQEYFADGIAEEILNALVRVEGLRVSGRTSSFYFKGKSATPAEIGRELSVATLLEGSVRKEGNRVRVTAQLIDAARGDHLWSETYEREVTGIFAVQEEVARAVVEALRVKILPGSGPIVKEHRATNPDAYGAYLLGRHLFDLGTTEGMRRAVAELERALALDPSYAPAWAWLSVSILNSAVYMSTGASPAADEEAARRAVAAAEKAVALGPDLAESWSARAWMKTSIAWDWAGAQADFQRALALSPRDTNILIRESHLLAVLGRIPEAIAGARKVLEIDPLYAWAWTFLASYYNSSGRPDLGRDAARRALEIAPEQVVALYALGVAHLLRGEPGEALAVFQREKLEVLRLAGSALAQHDLRNAAEERRALDALRSRFADTEPYEIAQVYAWRGDQGEALDWLRRAATQKTGRFSRLLIRNIKHDPLLQKVRGDPRYAAVLREMGLPGQ